MLLLGALLLALLLLAALVYPGELSHLSPALNRWLYDRGAGTYERKWSAPRFRDPVAEREIVEFARRAIDHSGVPRLLDLGCGTGRGARLLLAALPDDVLYVGIDQSVGMLGRFRAWLAGQPRELSQRVELRTADLARWAKPETEAAGNETCGLVVMLEVGEFLPAFAQVIERACTVLAPGGGLVLTRPAGWWWVFFPRRQQSRRALTALLVAQGLPAPEFRPWRARYELVFASRPEDFRATRQTG